jgi:DNA-directed RNA polymerase specialized sigma24 family protein
MSTSVPPRNDDPSDASQYRLPLADEQSLRRVFDETYPALLAEAQAQLGDSPHLAPRVVEGAFVCAWQEREELRGPAQLRSYLSSEVQHGAVRALSRKSAAHRMGRMPRARTPPPRTWWRTRRTRGRTSCA